MVGRKTGKPRAKHTKTVKSGKTGLMIVDSHDWRSEAWRVWDAFSKQILFVCLALVAVAALWAVSISAGALADANTTTIRRATVNLRAANTASLVRQDVEAVAKVSDVIGFQEIDDSVQNGHVDAVMALKNQGWSVWWPGNSAGSTADRDANQVAIAWRADRFKQVDSDVYMVHGAEAGVTPARFVVDNVLQDRSTGFTFADVNGQPVTDAWTTHPEQQPLWNQWAQEATGVTSSLANTYPLVLGSADLGRNHWTVPNTVMYYGSHGTYGAAFDDAIWSSGSGDCSPDGTQQLSLNSDHDALVTTFVCNGAGSANGATVSTGKGAYVTSDDSDSGFIQQLNPTAYASCARTNDTSGNCSLFSDYINPFVNFLAAAVGVIAAASILLGGLRYRSAGRNKSKMVSARQHITRAVTVLVIFCVLYALYNWLVPGGLV